MTLADKTALVTGANRGLGRALVAEALAGNAGQVYASTRRPLAHPDPRVTPLMLDVTNADQVQAAARQVGYSDSELPGASVVTRVAGASSRT